MEMVDDVKVLEIPLKRVINEYEDTHLTKDEKEQVQEELALEDHDMILTPYEFVKMIDEEAKNNPERFIDYIDYDKLLHDMREGGEATLIEINGIKTVVIHK
ncbi:MAG: hypothetical protein RBT32_08045 [Methanothermobacter sp.]|nr:hypothetical protein [Methanothermobacter sp.]